MNLEKLNLVELNAQEVQEIDGGVWGEIVAVGIALGGGLAWAFDKGEAFGRHLAQAY
ncbi:class IIb bacteriocin, lactobin A/cerein 7B family [Flavobacterium lipolyticum]|uniref:Class IIb bacteriocin, lactobin A/cerein 7B family n=1 Tax=Flavobacterium lipolyticum TaxID=2893754 RepID=A0ABS8LVC7_9FLAO|nr:class IIb bacteriocin, lactobin A/cerein 7B family [Flavobacterium sp. F-126]MCC9016530.1 class IIb bacteriocin, lactobin A/cerein 7B family [Flavobacterium sp. F-126]